MKIRCMHCMQEYEDDVHKGICPYCGYERGKETDEIYHLKPETVLSERYIVGTVISFGGFGILYRAWDRSMDRMIAIKEYFPTSCVNRDPDKKSVFVYAENRKQEFARGKKDFLNEARNTARFSQYDNIVNVFNYFEENGTAYMAMEFMDGITLKEYLKQHDDRISWEETVKLLLPIMEVLKDVHTAGILHRDISPDNIMLCKDGKVKLFDFGAARFSDEESDALRTVILKMGYAPPEQYRKKSRQGPWTDVYALGATMYRCISGKLPDESVNRLEAVYRKEQDPLKELKDIVPEIPGYLNTAIMRAMSLEPELRFKDMRQFKDAVLNNRQFNNTEEEVIHKKRIRFVGILLGICISLTGLYQAFRYYREQNMEAYLGETTITVWVKGDDAQAELFELMTEEFRADYPYVQVEVSAFPEEEYEARIQNVLAGKERPASVFECPEPSAQMGIISEPLTEFMASIPRDEYLEGLGWTAVQYPYAVPLGIHASVIYYNTVLIDDGEIDSTNDRDLFLDGGSAILVSDEQDYPGIQEALPGLYGIDFDTAGTIICCDRMFSVSRLETDLNKAAGRKLLQYYLGENAQDIMNIQNRNAIPVNLSELDTYFMINVELEPLKEKLLTVSQYLLPDSNTDIDAFYQDKLTEIIDGTLYQKFQ